MPDPVIFNKGQDDLIDKLEKAICSATDEWGLTVIDVIGCIEFTKMNYERIANNAIEKMEDDDGLVD